MISVRLAKENDIAAIAAIEKEVADTPWSEAQFSEELKLEHARLLVAEDAEVIGFLDMHIASGDAHINELGVTRSHQRRGVGAALTKRAIELANEEGCFVISLEVRESNDAAIKLYETRGLRAIGRRKRFYTEPVEDALIMLKEL